MAKVRSQAPSGTELEGSRTETGGESQHLGGRLRRLFPERRGAGVKDSMDQRTNPKFEGRILIEARRGHDTGGWTRKEMLDAMAARMMSRETVRPE